MFPPQSYNTPWTPVPRRKFAFFLSIIMEQSVSTEAVSFFCPVTGVAWRDILSTWINRIYFLWVNRRRLGDGTLSKPVANEGR